MNAHPTITGQGDQLNDALKQCDWAAEAFSRSRRICERLAPCPPLNLHQDGRTVTTASAEAWFDAETRYRNFRRQHLNAIRERMFAKIAEREQREAHLLTLDKGLRAYSREMRS